MAPCLAHRSQGEQSVRLLLTYGAGDCHGMSHNVVTGSGKLISAACSCA